MAFPTSADPTGDRSDDPAAWSDLGMFLAARGQLAESLRAFDRAVRLGPEIAAAWSNLGEALRRAGRSTEALACADEAIRLEPASALFHYNRGRILHDLDRLEAAIAAYERALMLEPGLASATLGLAAALEAIGEIGRALRVLREGLVASPGHPALLSELATRARQDLEPAYLSEAEAALGRDDLIPRDRWALHFGLAHVHDGLGDARRAASLATEANALRCQDLRNSGRLASPSEHVQAVRRMIEAFGPGHFEWLRQLGAGLDAREPVFIVGVPRSGTTLVEQILASHPQAVGVGELRLAQQGFTRMARLVGDVATLPEALHRLDRGAVQTLALEHLGRLRDLAGEGPTRIVDKMPGNMLFVGWLATLFPRAKFLACDRDPRDTALSLWFTNFSDLNWAFDAENIATRIEMNAILLRHWQATLPDAIRVVSYEQLVSDPEPVIRSTLEFLGLDWDDRCLEFHRTRRVVKTASLAQVRSPVHQRSVGRWRRYEAYLEQLFGTGDA